MNPIIDAIELYVVHLLNTQLDSRYLYHNLAHTQRVVETTKLLSEASELDVITSENLIIAAWFHDTGFIKNSENHEAESAALAKHFLESKGFEKERIDAISKLILATKMGHVPNNEYEKIIIDADCAHLASKNFSDTNHLLRKEWELLGLKKLTDKEWLKENINFFSTVHKYHSDYALKHWIEKKEKNLSKLMKNLKKLDTEEKKYTQKQEAIKFKQDKKALPERGVETMFRVALKNHMTLSNIADTKANILLSVNAIIISLALSNLLPKLDNPSNNYLIIPTVIFVIFTVASIILSILATRPNVTQGKFTKDDVAKKNVNLLFFGNFHQMDLDDFEWGISEMMQDRDYLYGSLTKDLYFLGLVLNRKYKILRITYTVFMIGIIISVIAFAISFNMLTNQT